MTPADVHWSAIGAFWASSPIRYVVYSSYMNNITTMANMSQITNVTHITNVRSTF